jgi:hypothetical protein
MRTYLSKKKKSQSMRTTKKKDDRTIIKNGILHRRNRIPYPISPFRPKATYFQ